MITLNTGAYIAEIVRSGIHAIDPGQRGSRPDFVMESLWIILLKMDGS